MGEGVGRYTYPWDTYPSLGYLRPLGYLPPLIPTPPYLPPGYPPPGIDLGPEIPNPQKGPGTRDTYLPPVDRHTPITFPQLLLREVKNYFPSQQPQRKPKRRNNATYATQWMSDHFFGLIHILSMTA